MKKRNLDQIGLTVLGVLVGCVIVLGLGFGGYYIYNSRNSSPITASVKNDSSAQSIAVPAVPVVSNASDLSNVIGTLNKVNPSAQSINDTSLLTSQSSF
jgi:hypothetical protein